MKIFWKYRIREPVQWAYPRYMSSVCALLGNNTGELSEDKHFEKEFREQIVATLNPFIEDRYMDGISILRLPVSGDVDGDIENLSLLLAPNMHNLSRSGAARLDSLWQRWVPATCKEFCLEIVKLENDWHTGEQRATHFRKLKPMPAKAYSYFMEQYAVAKYAFENPRRKPFWEL